MRALPSRTGTVHGRPLCSSPGRALCRPRTTYREIRDGTPLMGNGVDLRYAVLLARSCCARIGQAYSRRSRRRMRRVFDPPGRIEIRGITFAGFGGTRTGLVRTCPDARLSTPNRRRWSRGIHNQRAGASSHGNDHCLRPLRWIPAGGRYTFGRGCCVVLRELVQRVKLASHCHYQRAANVVQSEA
jgi:hypothetical protein